MAGRTRPSVAANRSVSWLPKSFDERVCLYCVFGTILGCVCGESVLLSLLRVFYCMCDENVIFRRWDYSKMRKYDERVSCCVFGTILVCVSVVFRKVRVSLYHFDGM